MLGGGAPWSIASGSGSVDRQGDVSVTVTGLIVVPRGANPIGTFEAVVSCMTPHGIVNVETPGFAATVPGGDSTINAKVALPHQSIRAVRRSPNSRSSVTEAARTRNRAVSSPYCGSWVKLGVLSRTQATRTNIGVMEPGTAA